jgi:uncharacterized damage-inducible protein DinB
MSGQAGAAGRPDDAAREAAMTIELIRELWEYHHWANRRLFDVTARLGDEIAGRDLGPHWSCPTLRRMFAHIYGADWLWLRRWTGESPPALPGDDIATLADLRRRWDALEDEQRRFVAALDEPALTHFFEFKTAEGMVLRRPLGLLVLHVPNHATHHRSEIATMLTIVSGSPPDSGIHSFYSETRGGAARPSSR